MNKWLIGIATAAILGIGGMATHRITDWIDRVDADHETLKQMWWKDYYLNGPLPAAPVTPPKK